MTDSEELLLCKHIHSLFLSLTHQQTHMRQDVQCCIKLHQQNLVLLYTRTNTQSKSIRPFFPRTHTLRLFVQRLVRCSHVTVTHRSIVSQGPFSLYVLHLPLETVMTLIFTESTLSECCLIASYTHFIHANTHTHTQRKSGPGLKKTFNTLICGQFNIWELMNPSTILNL